MATSYTSLLGLALPVTGELDGTWGTTVNDSITELVEDAIAATATASVTSGDWTLTTTGSGAVNQARCAILVPTGNPGISRNIIAPSQSKAYIVDNQSDGAVVVKGSATTGTSIPAGAKAVVAWSGSDFVTIASSATDGVSTISFGTTGLTPSTATSGAVTVSGTLAVANGGTGITSFGTGVATWLGTPSSANLAAAVTDETGTGALVFANTPTLVTPVLGTPTSGALTNCTADGTNAVGYRNIPAVADKTTSYQLATGDVGKVVGVGSGGSITIPNSTFAAGDAVLIFNNTAGDVTITCSVTTAYIAGTDEDKASVTLATRGVANILFISSTACVITGNVS